MVGRVDWALDIVTEQDHSIRSILEDLEGSMQAVRPVLHLHLRLLRSRDYWLMTYDIAL